MLDWTRRVIHILGRAHRLLQATRDTSVALSIAAAFAGAAVPATGQQHYRQTVVIQTGQGGATAFDSELSLNNRRTIAAIAHIPDGQGTRDNIFARTGNDTLFNITPGLNSASQQHLSPAIELNDNGDALVRRYIAPVGPFGPQPITYLEVWNTYTPSSTVLKQGA